MVYDVTDLYNLTFGGNYVNGSTRYLWTDVNDHETSAEHRAKLDRAAYPNFQKKIVATYLGYIASDFNSAIQPSDDAYDIKILTRNVVKHGLIGGHCWVLVLQSGPKVYRTDEVNIEEGNGMTVIRICRNSNFNSSLIIEFKDGQEEGVIYMAKGNEKSKPEPIFRYQLVECYHDETKHSLLVDTAPANVKIYNYDLKIDDLVNISSYWNTYGPDVDKKKVTPRSHISMPDSDSTFGMIQPDSSRLSDVASTRNGAIMNMAAMVGLMNEFSEELKINTSGVQEAYQQVDINSIIVTMAFAYSVCVNMVANVYATITGTTPGRVSLNPILRPTITRERMEYMKYFAEKLDDDELLKVVQSRMFDLVFYDATKEEQEIITRQIKSAGGSGLFKRGELDVGLSLANIS